MWWKRKQRGGARRDSGAAWIAARILRVQRGWALYMQARTAGMSVRQLKIGLLLFSLLFGGGSGLVLVRALQGDSGTPVKPDSLALPRPRQQLTSHSPPTLSRRERERIDRFKKYRDSLRAHPDGRRVYDSLLKSRPGLLDSLHALEAYYSPLK